MKKILILFILMITGGVIANNSAILSAFQGSDWDTTITTGLTATDEIQAEVLNAKFNALNNKIGSIQTVTCPDRDGYSSLCSNSDGCSIVLADGIKTCQNACLNNQKYKYSYVGIDLETFNPSCEVVDCINSTYWLSQSDCQVNNCNELSPDSDWEGNPQSPINSSCSVNTAQEGSCLVSEDGSSCILASLCDDVDNNGQCGRQLPVVDTSNYKFESGSGTFVDYFENYHPLDSLVANPRPEMELDRYDNDYLITFAIFYKNNNHFRLSYQYRHTNKFVSFWYFDDCRLLVMNTSNSVGYAAIQKINDNSSLSEQECRSLAQSSGTINESTVGENDGTMFY